jgi:hypothetical protein
VDRVSGQRLEQLKLGVSVVSKSRRSRLTTAFMSQRARVRECLVREGVLTPKGSCSTSRAFLPLSNSATANYRFSDSSLKHGSTLLGRKFASRILRFHFRSKLLEPCNRLFL